MYCNIYAVYVVYNKFMKKNTVVVYIADYFLDTDDLLRVTLGDMGDMGDLGSCICPTIDIDCCVE